MAGMLPGVEAARRRRFPHTNNPNIGVRSSLCLYERNHVSQARPKYGSDLCLQRTSMGSQDESDQSLDTVAREAKTRLDQRLKKAHLKSDLKRPAVLHSVDLHHSLVVGSTSKE